MSSSFFTPNLQTRGRVLRILGALLNLGCAIAVWSHSTLAAATLLGLAAFLTFEAFRGWCVLRACGVKTKH